MSETKEAERRMFLIFLENNPPQSLASSQDLVKAWLDQLEDRSKKGDWWRPIEFRDDDTGQIVCAYSPYKLIGVVQGGIAPKGM